MKKLIFVIAATILAGTSYLAIAADNMKSGKGMMMDMKKFDANADGMLSKEEFMKAHEEMFDRMKGPNGMVSMKDMSMHDKGMMGKGKMMGKDHQMPDPMEKGAK
jgi:hypothetical protein